MNLNVYYKEVESFIKKLVKHSETIRQLLPTNCLSVFGHFVGLALKGLTYSGIRLAKSG